MSREPGTGTVAPGGGDCELPTRSPLTKQRRLSEIGERMVEAWRASDAVNSLAGTTNTFDIALKSAP